MLEINHLKTIRKNLGLTQSQMAKQAGVSQSLIAKIESDKLDPTYSNVKKIFDAIEHIANIKEKKARDVMTTKIISIKSSDDIRDAIRLMKRYQISQLPVFEDKNCIGRVSESNLIDGILDKRAKKIKDIMKEPPPMISDETRVSVLSNLLKYYQMVLITRKGTIKGIITKSDIIRTFE